MRKKLFKIAQAAILAIAMAFTFSCSSDLEDQLKDPKETATADFVGIWRGGNTKEGYIFIFTADGKYIRSPEINSPDDAIIQMAAEGRFGDATLKYTANGSNITFEKYNQVQCITTPCEPQDWTTGYGFIFSTHSKGLRDELILESYEQIILFRITSQS